MATTRELLVKMEADPSGVQRGIAVAVRELNRLDDNVRKMTDASSTAINQEIAAFETLARAMGTTDQAARVLRARADELAVSLARAGASDVQINRIGAAVDRVDRVVGQARIARAFQSATQQTSGLQRAVQGLHGSTMIGLSELTRGIAKVAATGEVGAFAMREFTGAAFRLAPLIGTFGNLIPIVGLLAYAVFQFFKHAGEEAEKLRKEMEKTTEKFNEMVDAADNSALMRTAHEQIKGKASTGFTEGVEGLRTRLAQEQAILDSMTRQAGNPALLAISATFNKSIRDQIKAVDDLQRRLDLAEVSAFRTTQEVIRPVTPFEPKPIVGMKTIGEQTLTFEEATKKLAATSERMLNIFNALNKQHRDTTDTTELIVDAYDRLSDRLTTLQAQGRNAFDPLVESIAKAQTAFEASDLIQVLRLGRAPTLALPNRTKGGLDGGVTNPTPELRLALTEDTIAQLLRAIERSGGVKGNAVQQVDAGLLTKLVGPTLSAMLRQIGSDIKEQLGGALLSAIGPVAVFMRAMEPALNALAPLFDRLAVPLAIVARVIVALVEPALRALWPVIRLVGIGLTFLGEILSRVTAAVAQAIGGLVKAIGNLIAKVPGLGGVGHAIANFGQSMLNFADGQKKAADEFRRARIELQGMTWDETAAALQALQSSAQSAADALTNIPNTYRIQRAVFLATRPINAANIATPNMSAITDGSSGGNMIFGPGAITINGADKSAQQLFDEVSGEARRRSMARVGTTTNAAKTLG